MANKANQKMQVEIPIRVLTKNEPLDFSEALVEDEPVKEPATAHPDKKASKKNKAIKARPPKQNSLQAKKRKSLIWMVAIMVLIVTGWIFYIKGVFSNTSIDSSSVQNAGDQLTNVFQDFNRIYSNVQKVNEIESSNNGQIEEFEERVFPQFEENQ